MLWDTTEANTENEVEVMYRDVERCPRHRYRAVCVCDMKPFYFCNRNRQRTAMSLWGGTGSQAFPPQRCWLDYINSRLEAKELFPFENSPAFLRVEWKTWEGFHDLDS